MAVVYAQRLCVFSRARARLFVAVLLLPLPLPPSDCESGCRVLASLVSECRSRAGDGDDSGGASGGPPPFEFFAGGDECISKNEWDAATANVAEASGWYDFPAEMTEPDDCVDADEFATYFGGGAAGGGDGGGDGSGICAAAVCVITRARARLYVAVLLLPLPLPPSDCESGCRVVASLVSKCLLHTGHGDGSGGDEGGSPHLAFEDLDSDGDLCISEAEAGCPCSAEDSQEDCDLCLSQLGYSAIAGGDGCISPEDWDAYIDGLGDGGGDGGGDGSGDGDGSGGDGGGSPFPAFEDLDSDGDLCISEAEFFCEGPCSSDHSTIAGGDGCISPEDFNAYIGGLGDEGGDGSGDGSGI